MDSDPVSSCLTLCFFVFALCLCSSFRLSVTLPPLLKETLKPKRHIGFLLASYALRRMMTLRGRYWPRVRLPFLMLWSWDTGAKTTEDCDAHQAARGRALAGVGRHWPGRRRPDQRHPQSEVDQRAGLRPAWALVPGRLRRCNDLRHRYRRYQASREQGPER